MEVRKKQQELLTFAREFCEQQLELGAGNWELGAGAGNGDGDEDDGA